jgi:hypothetical protein
MFLAPASNFQVPFLQPQFRRGAARSAAPILTDLVSYWNMDETSDTRFDSLGVNQLNDNNGVGFTTGILDNCATFDGANQSLSHADTPTLRGGNFGLTFSGWVWFDSVSGFPMVFAKTGGDIEYELFAPGGTSLTWRGVFPGGLVSVDKSFGSLSTWYYFECWHDSVHSQIGIDINNSGSPAVTGTGGGGFIPTTGDFAVGSRGNGVLFLPGRVDEFGLWHRLFTADDSAARYNGGSGNTYPFS